MKTIDAMYRLLVYTDKQVKEVARETGYEDPAYFSRLFVQTYKLSPGSYRINNQKKMP
jgi:AraC family 4-hydroxyphenylacetate 3-monooxygenase operon regulatory protein